MIVGEAEVLVRPVATGFDAQLLAQTQPGFAAVEGEAAASGKRAGQKMGAGLKLGLLAGMAGLAFEAGKEVVGYQDSVAKIAASADISVKAAGRIGDAFQTTAGKSIYSATQMAEAFSPVAGQLGALQGHALNAAQSLDLMRQTADLAEAANISLGNATQDTANVMQAYHIQANQANTVTDDLFTTARLTGFSVDTLTSTLDRLKSKLGEAAPSLGESGGLLLSLAQHGVTGRASMTALNGAFTTLLSNTPAVTKAASDLGVTVFDASNKFVGMKSVIAQLQPVLAQQGEAQQLATTKALFGASANKQLIDIILAGPSAYQKDIQAVTQAGAAHDAAQKQSQTLGHQLDLLKATAIDLAVKFLGPVVGGFATFGKTVLDVTQFVTDHKALLVALAVVVGGPLTIAVAAFTINKMGALKTSFLDATHTVEGFIQKIPTLIGSLTSADGALTTTGDTATETGTKLEGMGASATAGASTTATAATTTESTLVAEAASVSTSTSEIDASFIGIGTAAQSIPAATGAAMAETEGVIVAATPVIAADAAAAGGAAMAGFLRGLGPLAGIFVMSGGLGANAAGQGATGGGPVSSGWSQAEKDAFLSSPAGGKFYGNNTKLDAAKKAFDAQWAPTHDPLRGVSANTTPSASAPAGGGGYSAPAGQVINPYSPSGTGGVIGSEVPGSAGGQAGTYYPGVGFVPDASPGKAYVAPTKGGGGGGRGGGASTTSASAAVTRAQFADALLTNLGAPDIASSQAAIVAWEAAENTKAANNPLAITIAAHQLAGVHGDLGNDPGQNGGDPVKNISTALGGVQDTADFIRKNDPGVLRLLTSGQVTPEQLSAMVTATHWGTEPFGSAGASTGGLPIGTLATGTNGQLSSAPGSLPASLSGAAAPTAAQTAAQAAAQARATSRTAAGLYAAGLAGPNTQTAGLNVDWSQIPTAFAAQQKATSDRLVGEETTGQGKLKDLIAAIQSKSLDQLNQALNKTHEISLGKWSIAALGEHTKTLTKLEQNLQTKWQKAMDEQTALVAQGQADQAKAVKDAQDAITVASIQSGDQLATDTANATAKAITDSTAVQIDQGNEKGLTGSALIAARAQTSYDQLVQQNDAAIAAAQIGLDSAGTDSVAQATAKSLLTAAQNAATTSEAQAKATMDLASAATKLTDAVAATAPTGGGSLSLQFHGANWTPADLMKEASWALKIGALPAGMPTGWSPA